MEWITKGWSHSFMDVGMVILYIFVWIILSLYSYTNILASKLPMAQRYGPLIGWKFVYVHLLSGSLKIKIQHDKEAQRMKA